MKPSLPGKVFGQFDDAARAVLRDLRRVGNAQAVTRAVAEVVRDHVRPVADDDQHFRHASRFQPGDDVVEDGPPAHGEHRLGHVEGEFAHPGAAAGGEENRFANGGWSHVWVGHVTGLGG